MASDRPKHPIYGGGNDPVRPQLRNSYVFVILVPLQEVKGAPAIEDGLLNIFTRES